MLQQVQVHLTFLPTALMQPAVSSLGSSASVLTHPDWTASPRLFFCVIVTDLQRAGVLLSDGSVITLNISALPMSLSSEMMTA